MSELEDIWCDQDQWTPAGIGRITRENQRLRASNLRLSEALKLCVDHFDNQEDWMRSVYAALALVEDK